MATVKIFVTSFNGAETLCCEFDDINRQFVIGVMVANVGLPYRIESDYNLPESITSKYTNSYHNKFVIYTIYNNEVNNALTEICLIDAIAKWKILTSASSERYTCVKMTDSLNRPVYRFDDLDFLCGLVNGIRSPNYYDIIEHIRVFDRGQPCHVNFKRTKLVNIKDIIKELTCVLDETLLRDLINIIGDYCSAIPPIIKICNIRIIQSYEYPMDQYTHLDF
jgi:hypothetical protein